MITIRKSQDRGHAFHGWLDSRHSFSFGDYYDPKWMGFRSLRVINEDRVAPAQGFAAHPHQNMEIITYVLSGQLKHKDSMGNLGVINQGEIQKMSAGTGVEHSEYNASSRNEAHFLQIWIEPDTEGLAPVYEQKIMPMNQQNSLFALPVSIHQDVKVFRGRVSKGSQLSYEINKERAAWVQVVSGPLSINITSLGPGDAAIIERETMLKFSSSGICEFLLFDLK